MKNNKLPSHKMQFTLQNQSCISYQLKLQLVKLRNNNEHIKQSFDYFTCSLWVIEIKTKIIWRD